MKIVLINNLYSPWIRGGAEVFVERLFNDLKKTRHEAMVITTAPHASATGEIYYLPSIFYNLGKYPLWQRAFWHLWDFFNFINALKIRKILKIERPDLAITHNLKGVGCLTPFLLRWLKIQHFHTLHDIQLLHPSGLMLWGKEKKINSWPAKIYQAAAKFLFGSPEMVISPSQWLLDEHLKRGFFKKSKTKVLPNYLKNFGVPEGKIKIPKEKFVFYFLGQLEEHKGVKLLVRTFLSFLQKNPQLKAELIIAGPGSQTEEIRKMSAGREEIKILGRVNLGELADLMSEADCLIVPSLCYENSPTNIYEAAAVGLPVLAANLGGMPELIDRFGGWLFNPGDEEDLLEKMTKIALNPQEISPVKEKIKSRQEVSALIDYAEELIKLAKA